MVHGAVFAVVISISLSVEQKHSQLQFDPMKFIINLFLDLGLYILMSYNNVSNVNRNEKLYHTMFINSQSRGYK